MGFIKFVLKAVVGTVIAVTVIGVIIGVIAANSGSKPVAAATVAATSTQAPKLSTDTAPAAAPAAPAATSTPAPKPTSTPAQAPELAPADIGDTVTNGNWQLTLTKVEQADVLGKSSYSAGKPAQGKYVIVTVTAKNLDKATSTISDHDFVIKSPDGVKYQTSSDGTTALMGESITSTAPKVLWLSQQIQPGLSSTVRLVFDVDPAKADYNLAFDKATWALHV